jgi:hypothetical protein
MAISDLLRQWSSYGHEYVPYLEQILATVPNAEALLGDMIARNTSFQDAGAFEGGWNPTPQYISNGWFANNVSPYASNSQEDLRNRAMSAATPIGIAYDFLKEQGRDPAQYGLRPEMAWELGRVNELTYSAAQDHSNWFQTMAGPIGIVAAPLAGMAAAAYGVANPAIAAMGAATFGAPQEAKFLAGLYGLGAGFGPGPDSGLGGAYATQGGAMDMGAGFDGSDLFSQIEHVQNTQYLGDNASWGAGANAGDQLGSSITGEVQRYIDSGNFGGLSGFDQVGDMGRAAYDEMMNRVGGSNDLLSWGKLSDAASLLRQGLGLFGRSGGDAGTLGGVGENPDLLTDIENANLRVRRQNAGAAYGGLNTFSLGDPSLFVPR